MANKTIYPNGVEEITVPATESIAISNFGGGIAKIYYLIETANYPDAYQFQQTLENSSVTLGAFTAETIVKIEAGGSKVVYDIGTAPDTGVGDADTVGGLLPTQFVRSDVDDTKTGNLIFGYAQKIRFLDNSSNNRAGFEMYLTDYYIGDTNVGLKLRGSGSLTYNGAGFSQINATSGALQLPTLASDPASGEAAGQIYYNTTSNVIRFYNGSAWGNV